MQLLYCKDYISIQYTIDWHVLKYMYMMAETNLFFAEFCLLFQLGL